MSKDNIKKQVEARRKAEAESRNLKRNIREACEQEISDDDLQGYLSENRFGEAKLYGRLFRGKILYVPQWDKHFVWMGHYWQEDFFQQRDQFITVIWKLFLRLADRKQKEADECDDKVLKANIQKLADKIYSEVKALQNITAQDQLIKMIRRIENPLIALPEQFDRQPYIKACPNGVIDLRTGELLPGRPDQYLIKHIQTEYDPELLKLENPCPEVNKFLLSSLGDAEIVEFIWRLLGYGLITKRRDHIFVIFWGEHGRNGKDTLNKLITNIIGNDLSGDVNVEMFLQTNQTRNSSSSSPDILDLRGKCFIWINEAEENQRFASSKLKKLTGGGMLNARANYDNNIIRWEQTHLPIMMTNELPKAKAEDAPFWARAIIVKWPFSFVDNPEQPYERQADKDLDEKLQAEAKGVLARIVRGAMDYLREGLNIPEKIQGWIKEQRMNFDDLGQFLEEWCVLEPYEENPAAYATKISAGDLHEAFCVWYATYRDKRYSISPKKFAELLNKKNIAYKRSNGSWRLGITLNDEGWNELDQSRTGK